MIGSELYLDPTTVKCWRTCQRRYYWRHIRHLVPDAPAPALSFGAAIHVALDFWHSHPELSYNDRALQAVQEFKSDFVDCGDWRNEDLGVKVLAGYFSKWNDAAEYLVHIPGGTEVGFVEELADGVYVCGRIDRLALWKGKGTLWPVDHKTSTRKGADYMAEFRPGYQATAYIRAMRVAAKQFGIPASDGMIINSLYFTKAGSMEFVRNYTKRTEFELEEWIQETLAVADAIWRARLSKAWEKNDGSCWDFFRECSYRQFCLTPRHPDDIEPGATFRVEPWKPYEFHQEEAA
jgi:hypothetical protein